MGILAWIIFGVLAGLYATLFIQGTDPSRMFITVTLGLLGTFAAGYTAMQWGYGSYLQFDIRNLGFALVGATVLLYGYKLLAPKLQL
jgi:uncharacterized membrane protein YeaQ/YmgE (transglycosylase-associated protein family)